MGYNKEFIAFHPEIEQERCRKIAEFSKGSKLILNNKGNHYALGHRLSNESKRKVSIGVIKAYEEGRMNPSKRSPEAREKLSKLMVERRSSGACPTWNKGLTKNTDERLKKSSEDWKEKHKNDLEFQDRLSGARDKCKNFLYRKGRNYEYRVKHFFESKGFFVLRSAGSKFPDLTVISPNGNPYFVECKASEKVPKDPLKLLSKEEYENAIDMISRYQCPFFLFYKIRGKMKAEAIGGKGITYLLTLKPDLVEISARTSL